MNSVVEETAISGSSGEAVIGLFGVGGVGAHDHVRSVVLHAVLDCWSGDALGHGRQGLHIQVLLVTLLLQDSSDLPDCLSGDLSACFISYLRIESRHHDGVDKLFSVRSLENDRAVHRVLRRFD